MPCLLSSMISTLISVAELFLVFSILDVDNTLCCYFLDKLPDLHANFMAEK